MMKKVYSYRCPCSAEELFEKLNDRKGTFHNWGNGAYLIRIMNDRRFFLGVGRGDHNGGYWYVADVEDGEDGDLMIRGSIVYNPDDEGKDQTSFWERVEGVFLFLFLFPLITLFKIIELIGVLIRKIRKKPRQGDTDEDVLDRFMIQYLHCEKV